MSDLGEQYQLALETIGRRASRLNLTPQQIIEAFRLGTVVLLNSNLIISSHEELIKPPTTLTPIPS